VAASRRGCTRETKTKGGGVKVVDDGGEVDDDELEEEDGGGVLRVEDKAAVRSEAGVEATTCSEARDEATTCSRTRIEDGRQRQHRRQVAVAR
jgi:hypothetical protein